MQERQHMGELRLPLKSEDDSLRGGCVRVSVCRLVVCETLLL